MRIIRTMLFLVVPSVALLAPAFAVNPPDRAHYQGVLRDASDAPRNGSFDMTFRLFDALSGGSEILIDRHLAAGTGAVTVSNGLFDVEIASGAVSDGTGPGSYTSLATAFRDFTGVWMQVEIGAEVLSPRIHVSAAPYALHARTSESAVLLNGLPAGSYLDTSATGQTKTGALTVGGLTVGGDLNFGQPGARIQTFPDALRVFAGDEDGDDLLLVAGNDINDGSIWMFGDSTMTMRSGSGSYVFVNGATDTTVASVDPTGTITATNDLVAAGNELRFGAAGTRLTASTADLAVVAGDADTDDLTLTAGNDVTDGAVEIVGNSLVNFTSGDGRFFFIHGGSGATTAVLDQTGTLFVQNDLQADGNELRFGAGARLTASAGTLTLAGNLDGDDLFLYAGNDTSDGAISIFGDAGMFLESGSGAFYFEDGQTGGLLATLGIGGTLTATQDLVAGGNEVHLGTPGSTRMVRNPTFDDLYFARDEDQNQITSTFSIFTNVGIQQMRINDGDEAPAFFDGAVNANGLDYAEAFSITDPTLEPGEVVVFDPERPGFISRATEVYSPHLVGVISGKPGFLTGSSFDAEEAADPVLAQGMRAALDAGNYDAAKEASLVLERKKAEQQRAVALAGRLPVKVDATYGPIRAGDHLTSSTTPGHAMAMHDAGPSIGVALESWSGPGTGVVLAFVQRGYYTPKALIAEASAAQEQLTKALEVRTPDPASGVQVLSSHLQYVLDSSGDQESRFSIFRDGAGEEPQAEVFRVDERGNVWAQGAFRPRSMDLAELFEVSERVEAGDVLVVDHTRPGKLALGRSPEDGSVVGVVAADPGVLLGSDVSRLLAGDPSLARALAQAREAGDLRAEAQVWAELEAHFAATRAPIALSGTVIVKADAGFGAIEPGDLLVTSPNPGHAMRTSDPKPGSVVGKALEALPAGAGRIRMLVWQR